MKDLKQKFVRDLIARFVEDISADSVCVLWTECGKDSTKAKIASWGNQFAIRDMIKTANDDYVIARINEIKAAPKKKNERREEPSDE